MLLVTCAVSREFALISAPQGFCRVERTIKKSAVVSITSRPSQASKPCPGGFLARLNRNLKLQPFVAHKRSHQAHWRSEAKSSSEEDDTSAGARGGSRTDWDSAWQSFKGGDSPPEPKEPPAPSRDSIQAPQGDDSRSAGQRLTRWGGRVRGGEFQMGEGTDRILALWGNGDAMLVSAGAILLLLAVLALLGPPPPGPPPM